MSTLLKDRLSAELYGELSNVLETILPSFDRNEFFKRLFDSTWESLELKQRMRHSSIVLHSFFGEDFAKTCEYLLQIIERIDSSKIKDAGFVFLFIPDYIEVYGINDYESSVRLIEEVTKLTSCEFCVRPFIKKYPEMIVQMHKWAFHEDYRVRRLASEGSRSRLPWAMQLESIVSDPSPILPIIEVLINDVHEWVRLSVSNSINDISKDNPAIAIDIMRRHINQSKEKDSLLKHSARTLLKKGSQEVLALFGNSANASLELKNIVISTPIVAKGEFAEFSFELANASEESADVRLEYAMCFLRKNGTHSKKVFKISDRTIKSGETIRLRKQHSFAPITTRTYYSGRQMLSVIINGVESERMPFELE